MRGKGGATGKRVSTRGLDVALVVGVMGLAGIGLAMVYSASTAWALKMHGAETYFIKRQIVYFLAGITAFYVAYRIPYQIYRSLAYPLLALTGLLLILVHVPGIGHSAGGATRWIKLPGMMFQPSELARIAIVVYYAYSMTKKQKVMQNFYLGILPHILVTGLLCGLLLTQPDFGSSVLLVGVSGLMLFIGGARTSTLLFMGSYAFVLGLSLIMGSEYRSERFLAFLNPWLYENDQGYQICHSLMAFGTGGVNGSGFGDSIQKLLYLPEPHTDFIFSIIGEEAGLRGVVFVVGLYGLVLWRGIDISRRSNTMFGSYLAMGITAGIGMQAFVNMGVAMSLLPAKGLTLPFLSYGGSSLLLNMAAVGILCNIGAKRRPRLAAAKSPSRAEANSRIGRMPWPSPAM
ncbi:MAG: putative lipid II flippase FtsW [Deltaproteobacteria bacterium]|nr:putative lipid II flippase FtsW [Deltaproteobacteria bacterium]